MRLYQSMRQPEAAFKAVGVTRCCGPDDKRKPNREEIAGEPESIRRAIVP